MLEWGWKVAEKTAILQQKKITFSENFTVSDIVVQSDD
jgi:hypothetical protein